MKSKTVFAIILCLVLAVCAVGCNRYKGGNYPVDAGGAQITKEPTAVVSLSPYISDIIYGLELEQKLVGRSTHCAFNGNVRALPDAGTVVAPDTAKIIELGAQVVFAASALPEEATKALEAAEIKVCVLPLPQSVAEVTLRVEDVARVLKGNNRCEQTSEKYLSSFDSQLEYVAYKLEKAVEPTGVFILSAEGSVATGDTLMGRVMELAGIKNIAASRTGYTMSAEDIAAADPDIIIVSNPPAISYITTHEVFSQLSAAVSGKIYEIGNEYAEFASPSVTKTIYALAYAVHGDLMAKPDAPADSDSSVPENPGLSVQSAVTSAG